jgi:hypothetical protein
MSDENSNGNGHIDFEGILSSVKVEADRPFEFMIPANLPGEPELLRAQLNEAVLEQLLKGHLLDMLALLYEHDPAQGASWEKANGTKGWEDTREALGKSVTVQNIVASSLEMFTEHMRYMTTLTVNIVASYSLIWAISPILDRTTRGDFRENMIRGVLNKSFENLDSSVQKLRDEVKGILGARSQGRVQDMSPMELRLAVKRAAWSIMRDNMSTEAPGLKNVAARLETSLDALSKRLRRASNQLPGCDWKTIKAELRQDGENNMSNLIS